MNCFSSVYGELGGRRAWEAASDLHRYHTPFVSDWEVDFLECLRAWMWWWQRRAPPHPGPPVWWCMLRSPLVAASCKYQVYKYIYIYINIICLPLYIGLHRFSRLFCFQKYIYANTIDPFLFMINYYHVLKHYALCLYFYFFFDGKI